MSPALDLQCFVTYSLKYATTDERKSLPSGWLFKWLLKTFQIEILFLEVSETFQLLTKHKHYHFTHNNYIKTYVNYNSSTVVL